MQGRPSLLNKIFQNQIDRNMEVHIDNMLVKSTQISEHVDDLYKAFTELRKHNLRLNPAKCAFGVTSSKFLGFMVTRRGIEANPSTHGDEVLRDREGGAATCRLHHCPRPLHLEIDGEKPPLS